MKMHNSIHAVLGMTFALALTACPSDDTGGDGESSDTEEPTTDPSTTMTTTTMTTDPTTTMTTDPTTTMTTDPDTSATDPDTSATDPDTGSSSTGDTGFQFSEEPYDSYVQIDRHGAVEAGTAGILASAGLGLNGEDLTTRDEYNASNPEADADGTWVPEIAASVMFFHANLDDDLMGLDLTPATFDESIAQAGPVIIPDTIKYDPSQPTAYPNGRTLTDPVVDITLAAVLLDLGDHPLDLFASLPLNPPANDVPFGDEFPYLAPPFVP